MNPAPLSNKQGYRSSISAQLQRTLDAVGMTAAQLSKVSEIPLRTVHRHLVNADSIKLDILKTYAKHLHVPLESLLVETDTASTSWTGHRKIDNAVYNFCKGEFDPDYRENIEALMTDDYRCFSYHYLDEHPPHSIFSIREAPALKDHLSITGPAELDLNYGWVGKSPLDHRAHTIESVFISGMDHVCVHSTVTTILHTPAVDDTEARWGRSYGHAASRNILKLRKSETYFKRQQQQTRNCAVLVFDTDISMLLTTDALVKVKSKTWQALSTVETTNTFSSPG
jgi:hypothetical protein